MRHQVSRQGLDRAPHPQIPVAPFKVTKNCSPVSGVAVWVQSACDVRLCNDVVLPALQWSQVGIDMCTLQ